MMLLLIDAYNLLHQSDVMYRDRGDRWLEKARNRLVRKLAEHLDRDLARETCLVFDAAAPPAGQPSTYTQASIQMLFAVDHDEADDLIEELIARHPTPKRLTVVSSDHRIQRAALRRGSKTVDADLWYARLVENGPMLAIPWPREPSGAAAEAPGDEKPNEPLGGAELDAWMREFTSGWRAPPRPQPSPRRVPRQSLQRNRDPERTGATGQSGPDQPQSGRSGSGRLHRDRCHESADVEPAAGAEKPEPGGTLDRDLANPFPEGYGEDLLE